MTNIKNKFYQNIFLKNISSRTIFILLICILPTFYFYILGRPRYVSQSEFIVRKVGDNASSINLSSFLSGGNSGSIEDAKYLSIYLNSFEVFNKLNLNDKFIRFYYKNKFDPFAGISRDTDYTKKYKLFKKQININLNENSGVLTLKTYSFFPDFSNKLNNYLVKIADEFVNETNQNIMKNQLEFARSEARTAKKRLDESFSALERYQEKTKMIDIQPEILASSNLIAALEIELSSKKIELATLKRKFLDPKAPEISYLEAETEELINQIKKERESLVSPRGKELNKKISILSKLKANLEFSKELYSTTLTTIEKARVDSSRQQRFITLLSKSFTPKYQNNNWRHRGLFTFLTSLIVVYGFLKFVFYLSDSHYD